MASSAVALAAAPAAVGPAAAAATPKVTVTISAHMDRIAFSRDGSLLAGTGQDGTVGLWSTRTGQPDGDPLVGHRGVVQSLAFHPSGRWLVTGGADASVRLWDPCQP